MIPDRATDGPAKKFQSHSFSLSFSATLTHSLSIHMSLCQSVTLSMHLTQFLFFSEITFFYATLSPSLACFVHNSPALYLSLCLSISLSLSLRFYHVLLPPYLYLSIFLSIYISLPLSLYLLPCLFLLQLLSLFSIFFLSFSLSALNGTNLPLEAYHSFILFSSSFISNCDLYFSLFLYLCLSVHISRFLSLSHFLSLSSHTYNICLLLTCFNGLPIFVIVIFLF